MSSARQLSDRQGVAAPLVADRADETSLDVGEQCGGTEYSADVSALDLTVATAPLTPAEEDVPFRELVDRRVESVVGGALAALRNRVAGIGSQIDAAAVFHSRSYFGFHPRPIPLLINDDAMKS